MLIITIIIPNNILCNKSPVQNHTFHLLSFLFNLLRLENHFSFLNSFEEHSQTFCRYWVWKYSSLLGTVYALLEKNSRKWCWVPPAACHQVAHDLDSVLSNLTTCLRWWLPVFSNVKLCFPFVIFSYEVFWD